MMARLTKSGGWSERQVASPPSPTPPMSFADRLRASTLNFIEWYGSLHPLLGGVAARARRVVAPDVPVVDPDAKRKEHHKKAHKADPEVLDVAYGVKGSVDGQAEDDSAEQGEHQDSSKVV